MDNENKKSDWDIKQFGEYCAEGEMRAHNLGNRGPIRFTSDGHLDPSIICLLYTSPSPRD